MNVYTATSKKIARQNAHDFSTNEQLEILRLDHPRISINIRYENDIIHSYNLGTISYLINNNLPDPYTLKPFRSIDIDRVCLYTQSIEKFPEYKSDPKDLFNRWVKSYDKNNGLDIHDMALIRLEAKCFLQAQDLITIFREYSGNGDLSNRDRAEKELFDQPNGSWLIRNTSILENNLDKPLVITLKNFDTFEHIPIVHRIGIGFYEIDASVNRGENIKSAKFVMSSGKPTIIDLIDNLPQLKIENAFKGNLDKSLM